MGWRNKYRVRRGFLGKCILQQYHCFPDGIPSGLAGSCEWVDVLYSNAPTDLFVNHRKSHDEIMGINKLPEDAA